MAGGEWAEDLVVADGGKAHGGDAAALGAVGLAAELAGGDAGSEVGGDGLGGAGEDALGGVAGEEGVDFVDDLGEEVSWLRCTLREGREWMEEQGRVGTVECSGKGYSIC